MITSYCGELSERTLDVLLQKLGEKGGEVNLLSYDETGHLYDAKYVGDYDDDDIKLSIMESRSGIVTNSAIPYPMAHDKNIGLALCNTISIESGDDQWGHLHLLHLLNNKGMWESTLQNKAISKFCAMYLDKGTLKLWIGVENIMYASLYEGAYIFSNSISFLKTLPSEVYVLEYRQLYVVSETIEAYQW